MTEHINIHTIKLTHDDDDDDDDDGNDDDDDDDDGHLVFPRLSLCRLHTEILTS